MPQAARTFGQLKKANGHNVNRSKDYERSRANNPAMAQSKKLRGSVRWQRYRAWYKRKNPICVDPLGIHPHEVVTVEQVHHIIGVSERPDLLCSESNCRSLCNQCHAKIEGMVRSGKETRHLFEDKISDSV